MEFTWQSFTFCVVNESSETRTTLKDSLLSHKMGFAAEYSRLHGGIPVKIEE